MRFACCFVMSVIVSCAPLALAQDDAVELPAVLTEPVPPRPVLPEDVAAEVAEMESQIEEMRDAYVEGAIESLDEAIVLAVRAYELRKEHQAGWTDVERKTAEWWEVGDARRTVSFLRTLRETPMADRRALVRADALDNDVVDAHGRGAYESAAALVQSQLALRRSVLGDLHPDTLVSMGNLGHILQSQGRLSEAEPITRESLKKSRELLGDEHPDTLVSLNNLAFLLEEQGRINEAEPYYRQALRGMRRVEGVDHPSTLMVLGNVGFLLLAQGSDAELCFREALKGNRRVLGDDDPETLNSIDNLGTCLVRKGRLVEAELYFREATEGRRRALGHDHPDTLTSIHNLAALLGRRGRLPEAETLYREALDGRRRVLGVDHPSTLGSINNMGFLLESRGRLSEAEACYKEAMVARRRVLGDRHPSTLTSIANLGSCLQSQGRLLEAEPYTREALEGRRQVLGDVHPFTLISVGNMGVLVERLGDLSQAEVYLREAMSIAESLRRSAKGAERGRAAKADAVRFGGIASGLVRLLVRRGAFEEAWTVAERGRARALVDLLAEADLLAGQEGPEGMHMASLRASEADARIVLTAAEARLATLFKERRVHMSGDVDGADYSVRLAEFDAAIEAQGEVVARARLDLDEATSLILVSQDAFSVARTLTVVQIQDRLEPGDLILSYSWDSKGVVLLTATQGTANAYSIAEDEKSVESLHQRIAEVREIMSHGLRSDQAQQTGSWAVLSDLVPTKVRDQIAVASRLVVFPDGPLSGVSFEGLAVMASKPSFFADCPIVYAPSATAYLNRKQAAAAMREPWQSRLLALGDPVFDRDAAPESDYPDTGVLATRVVDGSNAAVANIRSGDVILAYGGEQIRDYDHLLDVKAVRSGEVETGMRKPDDAMPVTVWRKGEIIETTMLPGSMGLYLDEGSPGDGLALMKLRGTPIDQRIGEASMFDSIYLYGGSLSRLLGTGAEVERIRRIAEDAGWPARALTREDATVANLEDGINGARILHIATHGIVGSQDRPYDASLALTIPETPTPDDIGFLRIDDMIRRWRGKLDQCDLVVLSACDTQRGIKSGTSMMALPWGFFYAGAPTVIASLWQVDDVATSLLMGRMYENLLGVYDEPRAIGDDAYHAGEEMSKIDALREAQQWLRGLSWEERDELLEDEIYADITRGVGRARPEAGDERTDKPYEHPYYWAAFVLIGDPG